MKLYKLLIFDIDGTLRHISKTAVYVGWCAILDHFGIPRNRFFTDHATFNAWIRADWHLNAHEIGLTTHEQRVEANKVFMSEYLKYAHLFKWVPDVIPALAAKAQLAVWTSSDTVSVQKSLGDLKDFFSIYMTSHELQNLKPHSEGGRRILEALDAAVEDALFIGDDPVDWQAAQGLNMDMAAVPWGIKTRDEIEGWNPAPTMILNSPYELLRLV